MLFRSDRGTDRAVLVAADSVGLRLTAERDLAAQAETAYRTMVAAWQPRPRSVTGAAASKGRDS